jgi:kinesin family protein 3/17
VEGLSEWAVRSPNEIYSLMQKGALSRATATTKMNDMSSRSHAVFIIIVEQMTTMNEHQVNMNSNYVDDDAPK